MNREKHNSRPPPAAKRRGEQAQRRGTHAEAIAAAALRAEGWTILAQRFRSPQGEIDIIAERAGLLAFIEVKARASLATAATALQPRQCARIGSAAALWLSAHPHHGCAGIRFDVLVVAADGSLRRITDAFRLEE